MLSLPIWVGKAAMFDAFCPGKRAHERKKGTSQSPEVLQARMVRMSGPRGLAWCVWVGLPTRSTAIDFNIFQATSHSFSQGFSRLQVTCCMAPIHGQLNGKMMANHRIVGLKDFYNSPNKKNKWHIYGHLQVWKKTSSSQSIDNVIHGLVMIV